MNSKTRAMMFLMTILTVLAISAFWTLPALADDEVPPPVLTLEPAQPPEEVPPLEETPAVEIPVVEEVPATPSEATIAETLAQLPEGTDVVVINAEGENIPLATQEAAEAIVVADPMWCPTGVAPGGASCSTNYGSLQLLVAAVGAGFNPAANGVIWISTVSPDASAAPIVINGGTPGAFATWSNFSLTLKGGWTEVGSTINTADPSELNVSLSIINWNADITLSDILITGAATGPALNIDTSKNITLTNVKVNANSGSGAKLDNTDSGSGTGNVTITSSQFNNNSGGTGLNIDSRGTITLTNVTASNNGDSGAYLDNSSAPIAKIVSVTNGTFNRNATTNNDLLTQLGLQVFSKGVITLKDIDAIGNGNGDADVDDGGISLDNTAGIAAVSLLGTNLVSENEWGLGIWSNAAITVSNLVAVSNCCGSGAYIDNSTAATAQPVTFTGFVQANYNNRGLHIISRGVVTLSNVTAMNNHADCPECGGVWINNNYGFASNVTLLGTNIFIDNAQRGLYISTQGIITLNNVSANGNGHGVGNSDGWGAYLDNSGGTPKAVKLTGKNEFYSNYSGGLYVLSDGAITISNLTASGNQNNTGAYLENNHNPTVPQNVTISGYANTSNNSGGSGMVINTHGVVSLINVTANDNSGNGIWVDNYTGSSSPKAVAISGINTFNGNDGGGGLNVFSLGTITLSNATANDNVNGYGAYLINNFASAVGGITLTAASGTWNEFARNGYSGIEVYSKGNITLPILDAHENGAYGVYVDNSAGTGNVTVGTLIPNYCSGYWNNAYSGLEVNSNGAVILNSICADSNGNQSPFGYGALIHTIKTVTLAGDNSFTNNNLGGLSITAKDIVTLNNLYVDSNGGDGVFVDNYTGVVTPKPVTINGYINTYNNAGYGLFIHSLGVIKLNNLDSANNGNGAFLDNNDGAVPSAVTITGNAVTQDNIGYGMQVTSKGAITFTLFDARIVNNGGYGWYLDNNFTGALGGITLSVNAAQNLDFNNNVGFGLEAHSKGAITITNLESSGNNGNGARLDNTAGTAGITLNVAGGNPSRFNNNTGYGLWATSNGAIKITELRARSNGGFGVILDNSAASTAMSVTLLGRYLGFTDNTGGSGLEIYSKGVVALTNIDAENNGYYDAGTDTYYGYGVYVDNTGGTAGVTFTGSNTFNNNWLSGLEVYSLGSISMSNVTANWNGRWDDVNDPDPTNVYGVGALLDNCLVDISGTFCNGIGPKPITLTGTNHFEGNHDDGLSANSLGAITVNNLLANWNSGYGTYLDNNWVYYVGPTQKSAVGGITITGYGSFDGNGNNGLGAFSTGAVTMTNLSASNNGNIGVRIGNPVNISAAPGVTITGTNQFNGNGTDGLRIGTYGAITLNNITANWNGQSGYGGGAGGNGVYLDNCRAATPGVTACTATTPKTITLTGVNTFYGNHNNGLFFDASGNVILNKVTADGNNNDNVNASIGSGVYGRSGGSITLTCGSMANNGNPVSTEAYGYHLEATGTITLKGVFSFANWSGNFTSVPPIITRACPLP